MRCLTDTEVSEWLRIRSIYEDPYRHPVFPSHYLQFHPPKQHGQMEAFGREFFGRILCPSEIMVHITDWSLYSPSEMHAMTGMRFISGETRLLIEAPGHVIEADESEIGIALFSLSASFGWSSYLYSADGRATLNNWEGEIFDFWTESDAILADMKILLDQFNLTETDRPAPISTESGPERVAEGMKRVPSSR